ncbi:MAG: SUF system NifU family Fe-S cluster assembly protein [Candidatus Omnitrophica bacterium]|nr:SUF system NifU family Fe-S cluster assembly protein [Candidatus Omnitrophota bacterium]
MLPEPELDDLYRDIILDHYRQPRNRGKLPKADLSGEGYNPLCGDEVTLQLIVDNGKVRQVMFEGRGCSISQASTSMMTEIIKGKTIAEVREMIELFKAMMTKDQPAAPELGDLEALEGVRKFPVRVKCATLAWNVLQDILKEVKSKK